MMNVKEYKPYVDVKATLEARFFADKETGRTIRQNQFIMVNNITGARFVMNDKKKGKNWWTSPKDKADFRDDGKQTVEGEEMSEDIEIPDFNYTEIKKYVNQRKVEVMKELQDNLNDFLSGKLDKDAYLKKNQELADELTRYDNQLKQQDNDKNKIVSEKINGILNTTLDYSTEDELNNAKLEAIKRVFNEDDFNFRQVFNYRFKKALNNNSSLKESLGEYLKSVDKIGVKHFKELFKNTEHFDNGVGFYDTPIASKLSGSLLDLLKFLLKK